MNRLDYFKARLDATMSPVDLFHALQANSGRICPVDVRNGPASLLHARIPGALQIPQNLLLQRLHLLPRNRELILYCWDTWCSLAAQAALPLIESGFAVRELAGGIASWKTLRFPIEPVDADALEGQVDPVHGQPAPPRGP